MWPDASGVFAQVEFQTDLTALVVLDLVDPLGRTLTTIANGTYPAGSHRLEIPIQSLAPGLYFLRQRIATQQRVVRFVVE
ncbi:MAG: T9SS type A sorting domain-containing protein [Flavobacteriales bacterium]|nr:T9SS type A sorting domain-containing protein [Flavobacteriales bacterium]